MNNIFDLIYQLLYQNQKTLKIKLLTKKISNDEIFLTFYKS